ncbi:MAG: helix-turn-helix domain-containing protein [Beijerinckiaceae bacterium]
MAPADYFDALKRRQPGAHGFQPRGGESWSARVHALEFSNLRIIVSRTDAHLIQGGEDGFRRIFMPLSAPMTLEGAGVALRSNPFTPILLPTGLWRAEYGAGVGLYFSCTDDALAHALSQSGAQKSLDDLWRARSMRPLARLGAFMRELWDFTCRFSADPRLAATTCGDAKAIRDNLLALLVEALRAAPSARSHEAARAAAIGRAYTYALGRIGGQVRLRDVAAAAGCPPRTLQNILHDQAQTTLSEHLAMIRLALAQVRLADPQPGASVTSVAMECGFTHMGEFSSAYQRRFLELPSETLARARRDPHRSAATAAKKTLVSPLLQ